MIKNKFFLNQKKNSKYSQEKNKKWWNKNPMNYNWDEKKIGIMFEVLLAKFTQNIDTKEYLLETGLRPLIKISNDDFWGNGLNNSGKNFHGKLLEKIRKKYLLL